jgi:hypothetical protein
MQAGAKGGSEPSEEHEMMRKIAVTFVAVVLCMSITACSPHKMYRTKYPEVCVSQTIDLIPNSDCEQYALQQLPSDKGSNYLLGFIEFDDQGQLWDRKQMQSVLSTLQKESGTQDLLLVVFAHGWKHSAAPQDTNINTFRHVLSQLSDTEAYVANTTGMPARKVAGVYLGWRGGSISVPYLENLTFWDRKNTAQKVGHGGVAEVLSQLEDIKMTKDSMACRKLQTSGEDNDSLCTSNTRLVVVGHSFGGAVVHTALAQILENRFIQTTGPAGQKSNVNGFGNLVVLINPAFEANLFTPLSDMATERGHYFKSQPPVLVVLTSEADKATGTAFPAGRWFSTLFEKEHDRQRLNAVTKQEETISEHKANITAVGHFTPYRTHRLYPKDTERKQEEIKPISTADSVQMFLQSSSSWENDASGSTITFGDIVLERTKNSAGRNPYLVTYVDGSLIKGHNDIDDQRVIEFIKQLIMVSSYKPKQTETLQRTIKTTP